MPSLFPMKMLAGLAVGVVLSLTPALAGPAATRSEDTKDLKGLTPPACGEKDWTLELGSGGLWSNVRTDDDKAYTIIPISLTASLRLDDVSLDHELGGVLRGYSEFFFRADYDQIVRGPETHYEGLIVGPRYNFVQPGWKLIPYVEGGVGFVFADSNPDQGGLGQDFNFTFVAGAGAKYNITDDFFVRLGVEYQHVSNAGLSDPIPNNAIDALGPKLSFGYSF
ncbi:MAG TPA: acyloxyacyl hydrolase [Candidatus Methylacidiphilales bacterium]